MEKNVALIRSARRILFLLAAALLIALAGANTAWASPSKITGVKQTDASNSSVRISWDAVIGSNICYEIEYSASATDGFVTHNSYAVTSPENYYLSGLSAGQTYYVRVRAAERSGYPYTYDYGAYSDPIAVVTEPSGKTTSMKQTAASTTSISLKWSKVSGANAYVVSYYPTDGESSKAKTKTVTSAKVKLTGLKKNRDYYVRVYAARQSGSYRAVSSYSAYETFSVKPTKVTGVEMTTNYLNINVAYFECSKRANADGYQYAIYDSTGKKKILSGTASSYNYIYVKSKKLKLNRFYAIKVRAYVNISDDKKVCGAWSDLIYFSGGCGKLTLKQATGKLSISWEKVKNATDYVVYVSTTDPSSIDSMTKVKTLKKTTLTLKKFSGKKIKKNKTYYVAVVARKKVGKKTYSSLVDKAYYLIH